MLSLLFDVLIVWKVINTIFIVAIYLAFVNNTLVATDIENHTIQLMWNDRTTAIFFFLGELEA